MATTFLLPHEDFTLESLKIAFDAMPVAIFWASMANRTIVYSNRAFHNLFGYEPGRFKTIAEWVEVTYPFVEDRALAWHRWGAFSAAPTGAEIPIEPMELRVLCHSGAIKTVLHAGILLPETGRSLATFTDITDHQPRAFIPASERNAQATESDYSVLPATSHSEDVNLSPWEALLSDRHRQSEALRLSEELLDRTGRLAGVGGWDVNLLTGTVTWTAETHRLHAVAAGYQPTLEAGINFYAPEARAMITDVVEHAIATGEGWDVEAPLIRADGQRILIRTCGAVEFSAGKPVRLIGAFQDITARVNERNALQAANERLMLATASGHIATWDWDIANQRFFWDDRMYRMYGLDPALKNSCYELWARHVHPEDLEEAERTLGEAIESAAPYENEFRVVWPDGSIHHLRAMGQASHDEQGLPTRIVGVNWDVTEQFRFASEVARGLKLELKMKDDFLSHVSHELRSPLASIYSFAGILADGLAGDITQPQANYLEIILKNSRQLRSMIEDLLQVTQSDSGKLAIVLEKTSVAEAVADAHNTVRAAAKLKDISLMCFCQDNLPAAFADITRLRQVLIILLDNAVKFTPVRGVVEVRATRSAASPEHIEIYVFDTGPGIEEGAVKRVFEHLYQVDQCGREGRNGLGLGLYIARDLVQRQGGTIWVESQPGEGSVFHFTVPIFTKSQPTNPWGVERRRNPESTANQGNQA